MDDLLVAWLVVAGGDEDVVHVDEQFGRVAHFHFSEHAVHGALEGRGGVGQSKEHYSRFEQPFGCFESGFPFVSLLNSDVIVSPLYVELGEEGSSLELLQDRFYQGEGVVVVDRLLVQLLVVLDRSEFSIFLFNEEEWRGVWGVQLSNVSFVKVLCQEFVQFDVLVVG